MNKLILLPLIALLVACSGVEVEDYQGVTPEFNIQDYFEGDLVAHGIVKNRGGKVIRYFTADIKASWDNGVGILDETFVFDDGEKQKRIWTLQKEGDHHNHYIGTASDVIGKAHLQAEGNALFLQYTLRLPFRGGTIDVNVDDRMYLVSPNVLINESGLSKFGFDVGEIVLTINKLSPNPALRLW